MKSKPAFESGWPAVAEYRLHPDAESELNEALTFYFEESESAAHHFAHVVIAAFRMIAEQPTRWPKLNRRHRSYILERFPYSVVYTIEPTHVEIVAVAHAKRKPGYWRHRNR